MTKKKRKSKPRDQKAHKPSSSRYLRDAATRPGRAARSVPTSSAIERNGDVFELPIAWRREPVLPEKALAYAAKIVKSRRLSIQFLKKAGIIERPGKLHRNYR